ncbi:uncharacterized protein LOC122847779 [Aphidius gifuensis]|uniref:uncharacterized protein LOC122847779 n=1 Tax=Aphidius gifuensis TaxID=684658 RepID=UPI001CDC6998|nr:uncharacterized protein LOC122847779 [Aphidius gifuensis]
MTMEKVCTKWEEACKLAWYDIKEYTFGESIGRFFDDNLSAPSYVKKLLSNFGIYLRDLFLLENCDSSIMPIIGERCKNLTSLYLIVNGALEINMNHYIHAFKNMDKLTRIHIRVMNMNIRKFKKLQCLSLSGCLLDDIIQGISETTTLVELSLLNSFNIRKFKQLQHLSLSGWLLDDIIQGISETTTLLELSLLNSFVSGNCLYNPVDIFNQFVNLKYIDIDNPWGINTPNVLNNILNSSKSIIHCNIMLLPCWNAPDISIKNWDNLQNLEHLGTRFRINNNTTIKRQVAPVYFDELAELQYLEYLDVSNMHEFQDSSLLAIAYSCENLQKLDISSCFYITEEALMSLTSLEKLEELSVGNIDGVTDNFISQLKGLKKLFCEYCKNITDAGIIECIKNCPNLDTLNLYHSNITINTLTGADEITKNRTNNIALCIFFEDFAEALTFQTESNWLNLRAGVLTPIE